MKSTFSIKKLIMIFLIIIIVALIIDYYNVMYPISKNFNYNFLNILINSLVVIFVFLLTYYMIDKQTLAKTKRIENNKRNTLRVLLMQVKKECNDNLDFIENQNNLEKFIIPKINFDSLNNSIEETLKNNPFKNEQYIIDLFEDGVADFNELEKYMNLKEKYQQYISLKITFYDLDSLIKMALIHYQFESIHPFYDGNGRTGRILNVLYLVLNNLLDSPILYLSNYINKNKDEYYRLFTEFRENNNYEDWIIYILKGIEETSKNTIELIKSIQEEMESYKEEFITKLPKIYSEELLDSLFFEVYTRINYIEEKCYVTRQTAATYLNSLVDAGLLEFEK